MPPPVCPECQQPTNTTLDARIVQATGILPTEPHCHHCGQYRKAQVERQPTPTLASIVKQHIIALNVAHIEVTEAKKALFMGSKLRTFHFVVYQPESANLLVWATKGRDKNVRDQMKQWGQIFGEGFVAVYAAIAKGAVVFKRFDNGKPVIITNIRDPHQQ